MFGFILGMIVGLLASRTPVANRLYGFAADKMKFLPASRDPK
jgi:hypothetical protein